MDKEKILDILRDLARRKEDDKVYAFPEHMEILLESGAKDLGEKEQMGGSTIRTVIFEGHTFITVSDPAK